MKHSIWIIITAVIIVILCSCAGTVDKSDAIRDEVQEIFVPDPHRAYAYLSTAQLIILGQRTRSGDSEVLSRIGSWVRDGLKNCKQSSLKLQNDGTESIDDYHSIEHGAPLCIAGWTALGNQSKLHELLGYFCEESKQADNLIAELKKHTTLSTSNLYQHFSNCD